MNSFINAEMKDSSFATSSPLRIDNTIIKTTTPSRNPTTSDEMAPSISPKPTPSTLSRLERQIEETTKELADERVLFQATRIRLRRLDNSLTSQPSNSLVAKDKEEDMKWLDVLRGRMREDREKRNYEACLYTVKHVLVTYWCEDGEDRGTGGGGFDDFEGEGLVEDYRRATLRKALEDGATIMDLLQQEEGQLLETVSALETKLSQLKSKLDAALEAESQSLMTPPRPKHDSKIDSDQSQSQLQLSSASKHVPTFRDRYIQAFKNEHLLRDREGMKILAKIGFDIRNRFLEHEYIQQCGLGSSSASSRLIVKNGDVAAQEPNALADAYLYHNFPLTSCEGEKGKLISPRLDCKYRICYGLFIEEVIVLRSFARLIQLANYHFIMVILRRYLEISPVLQINKQSPLFGIEPEKFLEGYRMLRLNGGGELWGGVGMEEDLEGDAEMKGKFEELEALGERGMVAWRRFGDGSGIRGRR